MCKVKKKSHFESQPIKKTVSLIFMMQEQQFLFLKYEKDKFIDITGGGRYARCELHMYKNTVDSRIKCLVYLESTSVSKIYATVLSAI